MTPATKSFLWSQVVFVALSLGLVGGALLLAEIFSK